MAKTIKNETSSKTMTNGDAVAVGLDLSDRRARFHAIDTEGRTVEAGTVSLEAVQLQRWASNIPPTVMAIEAGTHSPWVSRLPGELSYEVLVANARKLRLIYGRDRKNDSLRIRQVQRTGIWGRQVPRGRFRRSRLR